MTSQQTLISQDTSHTLTGSQHSFQIHLTGLDCSVTPRQWSENAQALIAGTGRWRLIGSAGAGVSSLLVDTALARLDSGVPIDRILIVTSSKKAAFRLRRDFSRRLQGSATMITPVVRSVTSLAFWLLQKLADEKFGLLPGAQFDAIIQDLLRGDLQDQRCNWPQDVDQALSTVSFARELKDFLLQVIQRDVSAAELQELGRRYNEPLWTSAGVFLKQVQEVMSLQDSESEAVHQYLEPELSAAAVRAWNKAIESGGFSQESDQLPFDTILVDNAQDLNPRAADLLGYLIDKANKVVIAGDPDQSVFRFRGANNAFLLDTPVDHEVTLTASFRKPHIELKEVSTGSAQRNLTVDFIRRAHLLEGVPWKDMAVIVRSAQDISRIRRALNASGVPVHLESANLLLTEHPLVSNLLLALKSLVEPLTQSEWERMASGLLTGLDQAAFKRIYRVLGNYLEAKVSREADSVIDDDGEDSESPQSQKNSAPEDFHEWIRVQEDLRRKRLTLFSDLVRQSDPIPDEITSYFEKANCGRDLQALTKLKTIIQGGYSAYEKHEPLDRVLWRIWDNLGIAESLQVTALRGGVRGAEADQDLNAAIDLFDALADFLRVKPNAQVIDFLAHISSQNLPTGVRDRRQGDPDAVTIVTAHGAVDREWKNVVIAGVQNNQWPQPYRGDNLFKENKFLDLVDEAIDPDTIIDRAVELVADERRLLHVATTRATDELLVIGVDSDIEETMPSRLFYELERSLNAPLTKEDAEGDKGIRVLDAASLIAELRRVVTDDDTSQPTKQKAAVQLARLAKAGFTAADPEEWWSTREISTTEPIKVANLSPSKLDKIFKCPLGAVAEELVPVQPTLPLEKGNLLHLYAESLHTDANGEEVPPGDGEVNKDMVLKAYQTLSHPPAWLKESDHKSFEQALDRTKKWVEGSEQDGYKAVGIEKNFEAVLPNGVVLKGKIDRLEKKSTPEDDHNGVTYRIIDYKSGYGKNAENYRLQLSAYDSALNCGNLLIGGSLESAGADSYRIGEPLLLYPNGKDKTTNIEEGQELYGNGKIEYSFDVTGEEERKDFLKLIELLLEDRQGSRIVARNFNEKTCKRCVLFSSCPLKQIDKFVV